MAINSTKSVSKSNVSDAQLATEIKQAEAAFQGQKKVKVSIPAILSKSLGPTLFVGINGVHINIPVDGEDYEVPEIYADHIKQVLANLK